MKNVNEYYNPGATTAAATLYNFRLKHHLKALCPVLLLRDALCASCRYFTPANGFNITVTLQVIVLLLRW